MKLLIVEDSPQVSERLQAAFAPLAGVATRVAASAAAALAEFRSAPPAVVILDLQLPDGDGLAVLRTIKAERPATRVLIFSGHVAWRQRCQAAGAERFFDKASDFDDLLEAVRRLAAADAQEQGPRRMP